MRRMLILAIALMVIGVPAFAVNVLTNGDFAQGSTGWTVWNQRGTITFDASAGDGWTKAANYNGGIFQQFNVVAGQTYTISGMCKSDPFAANKMWAEVLIINNGTQVPVNGTDLGPGGSVIGCAKEDSWATTSSWNKSFSQMNVWTKQLSFVAASNKATIVLKSGNIDGTVTGIRWDNVVVDGVVPEPGSIVALMSGLVGFGGLMIRRKR